MERIGSLIPAPFPSSSSWLQISEGALHRNLAVFKEIAARKKISLGIVLKANAYGHGLEIVYSILYAKVDAIYLITPQDAYSLRNWEKKHSLAPGRIVVLGSLSPVEVLECCKRDIEMALADPSWKQALEFLKEQKIKKKAKIHIHLDTGFSREGFLNHTLKADLKFLKNFQDVVEVKAVMSHFADTEDVRKQGYALKQVLNFKKAVGSFKKIISKGGVETHFAASAATLVFQEAHFSGVRVGISLYGFWPSQKTKISAKSMGIQALLSPALEWKCKSQCIKLIKKGTMVGYGCTYQCERDTWIAVFPVGYFDGYSRVMTGKAHVLVHGKKSPVLGRIMMNHIIVDVTHVKGALRKRKDGYGFNESSSLIATLIGKDGDETISAEKMASWSKTIHYEVVSRLGGHLRRVQVP